MIYGSSFPSFPVKLSQISDNLGVQMPFVTYLLVIEQCPQICSQQRTMAGNRTFIANVNGVPTNR